MIGLTQSYTTPYALTLNATTQQIGLLVSIPNFTMSLAQLAAPGLSERMHSRKSFILHMGFISALMWLPILLIPYIFSSNQVWWLITFLTIGTVFDSVTNPPWASMMADLVPEKVRGRFFGRRNRIAGFISGIFAYVAGGILQLLTGNTQLAFTIIFIGAMGSRLTSVYFLSRMYEPLSTVVQRRSQDSLLVVSRGLLSSNTGRFIVYCALINLTMTMAGPFFTPYMLRELKFNYMTYTIINSTAGLATIGFMTWWGKRTDKAGNIRTLKFTSLLIPFVPILWSASRNFWWLTVVQVFAGFAWAGFQLSSSVFIFDASPQENRTRYVALYNALIFFGVSIGSLIGGILAPHLPVLMGSSFLSIFLLSGLSRIVVVFLFVPRISEVRDVPKISTRELLFEGIEPAKWKDLPRIIINGIARLKKRRLP